MLVWFDLYVVTMKGSVYPQKSLCGLRHLKMMSWPPSPVFCSQKMLSLGTQATPLLLLTGALHCLSLTVHSFLHGQQWLLHLSDMRRALGNATVSVFFHLAVPCMSSFTLAFFSFQVYLSFFSFDPRVLSFWTTPPPPLHHRSCEDFACLLLPETWVDIRNSARALELSVLPEELSGIPPLWQFHFEWNIMLERQFTESLS